MRVVGGRSANARRCTRSGRRVERYARAHGPCSTPVRRPSVAAGARRLARPRDLRGDAPRTWAGRVAPSWGAPVVAGCPLPFRHPARYIVSGLFLPTLCRERWRDGEPWNTRAFVVYHRTRRTAVRCRARRGPTCDRACPRGARSGGGHPACAAGFSYRCDGEHAARDADRGLLRPPDGSAHGPGDAARDGARAARPAPARTRALAQHGDVGVVPAAAWGHTLHRHRPRWPARPRRRGPRYIIQRVV